MAKRGSFFIAIALIIILAETSLLAKVDANPYYHAGEVSPDSQTFPPEISVLAPVNHTFYSKDNLPLIFNVTPPQSKTAFSTSIKYVAYQADWVGKTINVFNGGSGNDPSLSLYLSDIPEGEHSILIQAFGLVSYLVGPLTLKDARIDSESEIIFTIDTKTPIVSIFNIQNVSSKESPSLAFKVNEIASKSSYVIDNQQNVTIQGNTTLPILPVGEHNVTVYAWDFAGNIGKSEQSFFVVQQPEPIKSEPLPITNIAITIIVIILVIASLSLLFRRQRLRKI